MDEEADARGGTIVFIDSKRVSSPYGRAQVHFEVVDGIDHVEVIAAGRSIRQLAKLRKEYGSGRWRKLKGIVRVRLLDGTIRKAEIHWYEAHGLGKKKLKVKRFLDDAVRGAAAAPSVRRLRYGP